MKKEDIRKLIQEEVDFCRQLFPEITKDEPYDFPNYVIWSSEILTRIDILCNFSDSYIRYSDNCDLIVITLGTGVCTRRLTILADLTSEFEIWKKRFMEDFKEYLGKK